MQPTEPFGLRSRPRDQVNQWEFFKNEECLKLTVIRSNPKDEQVVTGQQFLIPHRGLAYVRSGDDNYSNIGRSNISTDPRL